MDRKTTLAIALMLIVAIVPSLLIDRPEPPVVPELDSIPVTEGPAPTAVTPSEPRDSTPAASTGQEISNPPAEQIDEPVRTEPVVVRSSLYTMRFSPIGARPVAVELNDYENLAPGADQPVQLLPEDSDFLKYRLVSGGDTLALHEWSFEPTSDTVIVGTDGGVLEWTASRGDVTVRITHTFEQGSFQFGVRGEITGGNREGGFVLVGMGPRLSRTELDSADNYRSFGVVTKTRSTDNLKFSALDPGEPRELNGPLEWIAVKSKYFVAAVLTIDQAQPNLGGALAVGGERSGKEASRMHVTATLPATNGRFSHSVYMGPQESRQLSAIGHDFDDVNPYGWIFRGIIHPISIFVMRILLWMHENLSLAYGWVLILFGIGIRVIMWPLQQKAMRSQMAMQAIQPEMQAFQQRIKEAKTPEQKQKLQQEMMGLYKKHGVNPLGGCLPMMLPMPILFALFFVFQNTIELRGVPFLWLPDLSRPDPVFLIPFIMAGSMYLTMKISQRGLPSNPQAKMMLYVMPGMFLFMGFTFPSGLNLYYAVQTLAGVPQQVYLSNERMRRNARKE